MNKIIDIEKIYSDCKKKITEFHEIKKERYNNWNSYKFTVSAKSFGQVLPALAKRCMQDNVSEEDTVYILEIYLLMSGDTHTQHGALVTHESLHELVRACRSLFCNS